MARRYTSAIIGRAATRSCPASSSSNSPARASPYGVTKLAAEQLCRLCHAEAGRGRRGAALLLRLRPASAARRGLPALLRGGRQTRDFTYVGEVVAAVPAAGAADGVGGEAYNIGGGSRVSPAATLGFEPATDPRTGLQAEFDWVGEQATQGRAVASAG